MSEIVLLLLMLLAHIVEDFHLQGRMADMKQKIWWLKQTDDPKYQHDYIPVLLLHGFEWAICVSIPVFFYTGFEPSMGYVFMACIMAILHSLVDHMKCNEMCINLVTDQAIHMVQIIVLFAMAIA